MVKKMVVFTLAGTLVGLYTTFVLQHLWNWFVTTAFHLPEISFWVLYGVVLSIGMFSDTQSSDFRQRQWLQGLAVGLDACIPERKYEPLKEQMDAQEAEIWAEAGFSVFGRLLASTVTLIIGGAVHLFLACIGRGQIINARAKRASRRGIPMLAPLSIPPYPQCIADDSP